MKRKLILYIAMSIDGYIARNNDDIDWLNIVEKEGEDYGYAEFTESVDTVILGRKTYDKVASMGYPNPHPDKEMIIISRTAQPAKGNISYYSGDLSSLIKELKNKEGKNIYCDGGAELVTALLKLELIDELIISVIPILLGDGIRLFKDGRPENTLKLIKSKGFEKGLVQVRYEVVR